MESINHPAVSHPPWNKGKLPGQKAARKQREIWAIRIRLPLQENAREIALFNLAIDSKLRSCDLCDCECDFCQGGRVASAIVMQQKTQRPVQFGITEQTRKSLSTWMRAAELSQTVISSPAACASPRTCPLANTHGSFEDEFRLSGFNPAAYGIFPDAEDQGADLSPHQNLRVVQLLLGHRPHRFSTG
jgi:hypothetical protein